MLVLTRRVGEQILINKGEIEVKVLYEHNGIITLGVRAPAHIDVDRKEVFLRKQTNAEELEPQQHQAA
ncbi:carbon storage regulator [Legionella saoudiensis]|uniref:carbon storage regulator n=1 Tax=Legionella saoudiensis TaxID=1750561 RepID=UPI000730F2E1|nr:carbon storage regulator [Legionella saoudiensis]